MDLPTLAPVIAKHGTPLYVYDWRVMKARIESLSRFDVIRYAQKANSNTHILRRMREASVVVDAVSPGELERALAAGYQGGKDPAEVVYTADIITPDVLERVVALNIPVNAGSIDMLDQVGKAKPGHPVWMRINPGFGHGHSRKTNTGGEWSKHGIWHQELPRALEVIDRHGLDLVGLHVHIGSGTDFEHLRQVCDAMVGLVKEVGRDIRAISGGGGLPIPYHGGEPFDTAALFELWDQARAQVADIVGHPVHLEIEPGRYLAGESGLLAAQVRAVKTVAGRRFVLVDAGFDNLVRPAMYGSYHRITVHGPDGALREDGAAPTVVAGPLCESGDVFTQQEAGVVVPRELPAARVGDLVVFHDAGAYASAMASNYNSRPLAAEVLFDDGGAHLIRRRQTVDELLALEAV
ncbi:MAG: diaminopimelate decarboxylase [Deltaproteobacteria bacterium]|nr:diaminopimelate decarboxylase [Deltaproteobacteria bacterium]